MKAVRHIAWKQSPIPQSALVTHLVSCVGRETRALAVREEFQKKNGVSAKAIIAFGLAVTVGLCAILAFVLWQDRNQEALQAERAGANVVATISSDIDRNLELYDLSLQAVVDGLKAPGIWDISPGLRQLGRASKKRIVAVGRSRLHKNVIRKQRFIRVFRPVERLFSCVQFCNTLQKNNETQCREAFFQLRFGRREVILNPSRGRQ